MPAAIVIEIDLFLWFYNSARNWVEANIKFLENYVVTIFFTFFDNETFNYLIKWQINFEKKYGILCLGIYFKKLNIF